MVDRGAVPEEKLGAPGQPAPGNAARSETQVTGVWRTPDAPGGFTPPPDTANLASGMPAIWRASPPPTAISNWRPPWWSRPMPRRIPAAGPGRADGGDPSATSILGYAVTWFGIAIVLLGGLAGLSYFPGRA